MMPKILISLRLLDDPIRVARAAADVDIHEGEEPLPKAELMARQAKNRKGLATEDTESTEI